jgi:methionyl-tRNA formyltransferase
MKVIILTSTEKGTASHHLEYLLKSGNIEIAMVVLNQNKVPGKKKWRKKIKKIKKIGVGGALNGIRMRKWYSKDIDKYLDIKSIQDVCEKNNIPLKYVPCINCDDTKRFFHESGAEIGISLGNSFISPSVFSIPPQGMINIHHEELPAFQNAQSIIWQLYNGSNHTGYTIHKIERKIDSGEILFQETMPLVFRESLSDTVTYNLARLYEKSAEGLKILLENYDAFIAKSYPQTGGKEYTTPNLSQFNRIKNEFARLKKMKD